MTLVELLSTLRTRDINLWSEGERLRYSAPSGALTPDIREELAKHKNDLLTLLNETDWARRVTRTPISRISREATLLPSMNQKGMWFIEQLQPNTAFNCYRADRIKGSLNIESLERSLNEIVQRHEALRTTFSASDGEPLQVIAPAQKLKLTFIDLRNLDTTGRETEAKRIITEEVARPFDLARGPLFRAHLLCLETDEHILLLTMHHIVTDGWSMGILVKELTVLYDAFCNGSPSPLPELPIQYVDFAHWQSEWLQGEDLQQELAHWKERLKGAPEVTELPTDYHRPPVQSFQGASERVLISKSLTEALKTLSKNNGVTLFMTLLAAFNTLLYRYTGQQDLVVGSPIAGRLRSDLENLIGLFINTLVLRTDLSGNPTFRELLRRVREVALDAYAHQDVPFEKLMEDLHLERSLSFTSLFQVMFVLQNTPEFELKFLGSTVSPVTINRETTLFDLFLSMAERDEGLDGTLSYRTDLFDRATINRMIGRFRVLLEGIVADPDRPISTLPLLTETERHQLLVQWNDTKKNYPQDECVHQLFEEQVERTPDAVAIIFGDQQLTYRELNQRANQLAHHLRKCGVGPELLVGICMERSVEMLVALFGVLKSGAAYVPLDPNYPVERLTGILDDIQAPVLLSKKELVETLPEYGTKLLCLDSEWDLLERESKENPLPDLAAANLAYVIYTSGSTGKPKGVEITHRALTNFTVSAGDSFALAPGDRVLQFASISFDTATEEIFPCLIRGATLVLRTDSMLDSVSAFLQRCAEWEITVLDLPTAYWHEMAEEIVAETLTLSAGLRLLIIGGERAVPERLMQWRKAVGDRPRLLNTYGPTEITVAATMCDLTGSAQAGGLMREVPIGHPISNVQAYILDRHLNPVPIGVPGEVHIGGDGLARGYLNHSELTAERFIPHPFNDEPGARLYRTGDLARYLPDGNIEFLGRMDHQVKVRGYRIELGEIEALLRGHPQVSEAAVLAWEDAPGDKRLVGYVVNREPVQVGDLRNFLKEKLPDYMVPLAFVFLDSLPLTPNGKVDRRALPAPDQNRPELEESYMAPRTPVEQMLAEIWAEVLKLEKVGSHDNFFELGGHSLLGTVVVSRIRGVFQVELPLRTLFESPTVAGLAERLEDARRKEQGLQTLPMLPASRDKNLPLSFAQQRLWFLDQFEPGSMAYNIPGAVRIKGPLNVASLEQSLNEIVRRHEALRTTFSMVDGEPVQIISPSLSPPLLVVDLSDRPEIEREEEARRLASEEARRLFDPVIGPLVRVTLLRLDEEEHVLLLTLHHIVSDGWSMGVLYRELSVLYRTFSKAQPSPLPELPIQYADFAVWQRNWLRGKVLETQLSYWKKQLEDVPTVLNLPIDRPRPAVQSFRGATQSIELSQELTRGLKILSRQHGVTLFMTLLAGFQTLLYRYTGQDDIVVGSPIANRNRSEIESLIGFFVNTLVLRTRLTGNPTFTELIAHVREVALGAYAHQDLPFEKLVQELRPERNLSTSPLFQVMFVVQNAPSTVWEFEGLTLRSFAVDNETAKFDLTLSIHEEAGGLRGSLQYSTDLFDETTITRMGNHFQTLLQGIVADPDQRLSELPLLTKAEEHRLLVEWNNTERDYPKDKCIHELFEEQVERSPDAIAVIYEEKQLTYSELNQRANQLAHHLRKLGVGPETLVGICIERSLEMVVGLLGILKAGGAYVPLDLEYPKERLAFMLEDTQARVLLTQKRIIENLPMHQAQVVCLDRDWVDITQEGQEDIENKATADNLAYVIYTSGSTGKPKGVEVPHRAVVRLLFGVDYVQLDGNQTFLHLASTSFDASTFEIWGGLLHGAKCVLFPGNVPSPRELGELLHKNEISTLWLTASLFNAVIEEEPEALSGVQQLLIGGEALSVPHVRRGLSLLPRTQIINGYGPTESTTFTCASPIPRQLGESASSIPIGCPIGNTKVYILDSHLLPVPIGVPGELCIGGHGLARGYLNQSGLTAERFISSPFTERPGARLYKTGDQARYLEDGNIEFLGRLDDQVKIRGFRIEPGEVESVLIQHPAVNEAVVVAREDGDSSAEFILSPSAGLRTGCAEGLRAGKRLVAYVVAARNPAPSAHELRSFLKQKLPDYMIPSGFVFLNSLPLTHNGKVDRRALPNPEQSRPDLDESYVAARTPAEKMIAEIWAEVLKLEKVGIHDNFFEFGGHSLLATQVVSRIREVFRMDLQLRTLFESPTVAELAVHIEAALSKEKGLQAPSIIPGPRDETLPLSFAQQRLWFIDQLEPGGSVYNVPSAWRLSGRLDIAALEQSLNEIVRRHETLRTMFSVMEGQPVQTISPSSNLRLSLVDLADFPESQREEEARERIHEEARRPFDLARGPLVRVTLLCLDEEDHVLFLTLHHIVSDGWSIGVLYRELSVLYRAFSKGLPSPLPDLLIQYADFAVWQRDWLQGEVLERQLSYWKKQLEDVPAVLNLPTDRLRPAVQSFRGARQSLELSKELTQGLKALSRQHDVTLFMTLLAAFQTLLHRYTGQDDIVVGSPLANRNRTEIEGLIGFFVNTLVLRTDVSGNPMFTELLARVREVALGAYAHQDLPFEKLVEELQPQRSLSHSPLFQVMFVLQNAPSTAWQFEGLNVSPVRIKGETTKFDLTLSMQEETEGLRGSLQYSTDLFTQETITRMLGHFEVLLESMVANPNRPISALPILTAAEKQQLLVDWNDTQKDYPRDKCLHESFEEQVERSPDAAAVVSGEHALTYRELNARANQLAHHLRKHGVGPDVPVGICLERSLEMLVTVLGILKAGGAYVPLDPDYPKERLAFMLEDANLSMLVTQQRLLDHLPNHKARVLQLDTDCDVIARESEENPTGGGTPKNLAYVIYTSGSTGKPKGVMIAHQAICNRLYWGQEAYPLTAADRVLQLASFSFDFSVWEFFGPLLVGARLIMTLPGQHLDSAKTIKLIADQKITTVHFVPSILEIFLEDDGLQACNSLRRVFCGGENLPVKLQERFYSRLDADLYNQYGPTEACIDATFWKCKQMSFQQSVPIGRPIANTEVYLLDSQLSPVPIGVPGELYIGGNGLARGYLNRSELTAEKFIANPFSNEPGARLYRTGDLARYLPDGNIEFLGRTDHQVKVSGYRIELGEIESVLGQHAAVREAAVLAREDNPGDKRLVAYVVPRQEDAPTLSELRSFLKKKLPEYMVPSLFVFLDALPLSPNGKVDRKALPAPDGSRPELEKAFLAPRTPIEQTLAHIWAEVLKREKIGIHDNFFDLGGHSLLATQVVSRICRAVRVELPLRALFERPTVEELAVVIAELQAKKVGKEEISRMLAEVESLSEEEAQELTEKEIA